MNAVKGSFRKLAVLSFVFVCLAVFFSGCGASRENLVIRPDHAGKAQLESAMSAYERGEFQIAAEQFQLLYNTADEPAVKKAAIHGLACSRLVLSENLEEFAKARQLWRQWRYTPGPVVMENERQIGRAHV